MENDLIYSRKMWEYVSDSIIVYTYHLRHVKGYNENNDDKIIIIKHNRKKINSIKHASKLFNTNSTTTYVLFEYNGIDFYYSLYDVLTTDISIDILMKYYNIDDVTSFKNYIKDDYIIITKKHIGKLSDYLVDNLTENDNSSSNVYSHIHKRFTTVE